MKAFPFTHKESSNVEWGMDLRDYFAAKAMNAYLNDKDAPCDFYMIAKRAYQMSDAMMEAREQ